MKKKVVLFLKESEGVGNENIILERESLKELPFDEFPFIDLPSLNIKKECKIGIEGISKALVEANLAIAETGTVVVDSTDEVKRLATSLCEELHMVVYESKIVNKLEDVKRYLKEKSSEPAFLAFITGASRTADIERVLTTGVHGPESMIVYLIKEKKVDKRKSKRKA